MTAVVQTNWVDSHAVVGSQSVAFTGAVTPGNQLIAAVSSQQNFKVFSVSDNVNTGSNWLPLYATPVNHQCLSFFAWPNTAAGTPTVTALMASGANAGMQVGIFEVSGTSVIVDQAANVVNASSATSSSVGPTGALAFPTEICICCTVLGVASAGWSAGGSYTNIGSGTTVSGMSYFVGGGAQTATFAWTTAEASTTAIITLLTNAAAGAWIT